MALIFVLVDGVGLAPAGPDNPVSPCMPWTSRMLGVLLDDALAVNTSLLTAQPIDATLGIPGLPQSGSGHSTLYGGFNAAAFNGRHQPSHPTVAMRERLAQQNLLLEVKQAGYTVAWANGYLPGYSQVVANRRMRHTAGTWSALSAGLDLRGLPELLAGTAVSWDMTQQLARARPGCENLPEVSAMESGERLARLATAYDFVGFETYLPDLAGHRRLAMTPDDALGLVDDLLAGIIGAKGPRDTLVVTSDHGNVEDGTTRLHTRNPVPLIVHGPAAGAFTGVKAIDEVMSAIIEGLGL